MHTSSSGASSPRSSTRDLLSRFRALRWRRYAGQSIRICFELRIIWQVEQRGTCLSAPLAIKYLWVRYVWPILSLVITIEDLLSKRQEGLHGDTNGRIDLSLKLDCKLAQWSCHFSMIKLWILLLKSKWGTLAPVVWARVEADLVAASARSLPLMPTWEGTQQNSTVTFFLEWIKIS